MICRNVEICEGICDVCEDRNGNQFERYLYDRMKKFNPLWHPRFSAPANDPIWKLHKKIIESYPGWKTCLVFTYDDSGASICKKHLEEIIKEMK